MPVVPQLAAPWSPHLPRGSAVPPATGRHSPGLSPSPQEWQALPQSDSQQKPSTQKPVTHSAARLHVSPFDLPGAPPEPPAPPPPEPPPPAITISTSFIAPRATVTSPAPLPTTAPAKSTLASQCSWLPS